MVIDSNNEPTTRSGPKAGDKRTADQMTDPGDEKKPLMSQKILLGVLRYIPRNEKVGTGGVKKLDLRDCQKVCKSWKETIDSNADLLPRTCLDELTISTSTSCKNSWPNQRDCPCRAALEEKAKTLAGQLFFTDVSADAFVNISAGGKIGVRNLMDIEYAWNVLHFFFHIRNCYFNRVSIKGKLNPLVGQALNTVHTEGLAVLPESEGPMRFKNVLDTGLIVVRNLDISVRKKTEDELVNFIAGGRTGNAEMLRISGSAPIDAIVNHFATKIKDLRSTFKVVEFCGWNLSVPWPTSIPKPPKIQPGGAYSIEMSTRKSQKFTIEIKVRPYWGNLRVQHIRLKLHCSEKIEKKLMLLPAEKTMPPISLETMVGILRYIPHNVLPTINPATQKTTLESCQKVCKRWDQIVYRHPALLSRTRIEKLRIFSGGKGRTTNSWKESRNCTCYASHEGKAKELVGVLIFPSVDPADYVYFEADDMKLGVRNKMDLNSAMDLLHFSHHFRYCYYGAIYIRGNLNPALGKVLYTLRCDKLYNSNYLSFTDLLAIQDAFTSGLVKVRKIEVRHLHYYGNQVYDNQQLDLLFGFLSTGRCAKEFGIHMQLSEVNRVTFVDYVIKHFTQTIKSLKGTIPLVTFKDAYASWPSKIKKPDELVPGRRYTRLLNNVHSNEKIQLEMTTMAMMNTVVVRDVIMKILD